MPYSRYSMDASLVVIKFGPYELYLSSRELYKFGTKVKLRPQPFQVLSLLVERSSEVVTREQLRQQLWPSDTFVDFEHSLNTAIKELRGVLSDSATDPRYIQTVPKLGYRFIFPVERSVPVQLPAEPTPLTIQAPFANVPAPVVATASTPRRRWLSLSAAAILLLGIGVAGVRMGIFLIPRAPRRPHRSSPVPRSPLWDSRTCRGSRTKSGFQPRWRNCWARNLPPGGRSG